MITYTYGGAEKRTIIFCKVSTILTECVDSDIIIKTKYGGICEINGESKKIGISCILK